MKPVTTNVGGAGVTLLILIVGGLFASRVPASDVAPSSDEPAIESSSSIVEGADITLVVDIHDVKSEAGTVFVFVFDEKQAFEAWDYEKVATYAEVVAQRGRVRVEFPKLRAGRYAVALFHDENGDKDFNMNGSMPLEGYGTSGARNWYDEPTFEQAAVARGEVSIQMFYPQ